VRLFRTGSDEAFRVIHDRYRERLLAYVRRMLRASDADADDVLQDVFLRASHSLRAHDRDLSLGAWLYRIARNACIDELRRQALAPRVEAVQAEWALEHDPVAESEHRETVRQLVIDLERLPDQQRSALLMRELSGMRYTEVAAVLGTSVPAVKSLLVRARLGLVQSLEAREMACSEIRDELAEAHARHARPSPLVRRHLRDCTCCRQYGLQIRGRRHELAALAPALGPLAPLAKLLGVGAGGSVTASGSAATSGGAAVGGAASTGGFVLSAGALGAGATHVVTVVVAAALVAAGAVGLREATDSRSAPSSQHHPGAVQTVAPTVPTGAASSPSPHVQSHRAAPSRPRMISPTMAEASSGAGRPRPIVSTAKRASPTVTTMPAGSPTYSSCPIGQSVNCSQSRGSTATGGSGTSTNSGGSTPPLGRNSSTTGAGTTSGASADTTTATGKATTTGLGSGAPTNPQTPTSSRPLGAGGPPLGSS
jgi:RNA polymerase sigma factor (sigma-70 family)